MPDNTGRKMRTNVRQRYSTGGRCSVVGVHNTWVLLRDKQLTLICFQLHRNLIYLNCLISPMQSQTGERWTSSIVHCPDCRVQSVLCCIWSLRSWILCLFLIFSLSSARPFCPFFSVTFSPPHPLPVGRRPICSNPALHCVVADAAGQTAVEPLYTEVYIPNRGVQQHVCQLV